jgi:hypothetical protein
MLRYVYILSEHVLCHKCVKTDIHNVGFQVLTAVVMISSIFWDITPCRPLKSTDVSKKHVARRACYLLHASFLLGLFFDPEDEGGVPPKLKLTFNALHSVIPQKTFTRIVSFHGACAIFLSLRHSRKSFKSYSFSISAIC